jgi:photosynthetic reaction center cytochrome c subunit
VSARLTWLRIIGLALALIGLSSCERPPVETVQRGYRGVAMEEVYDPRLLADQAELNTVPVVAAALPGPGPKANTIYKNVPVLGELDAGQFVGTMAAMTAWVAPKQGCTYCHDVTNFASDSLYTKVVARRMLQMTQHLNQDWQTHVAQTGVTCYTCHRGEPVPSNVWFTNPGEQGADGIAGNHAGKNQPSMIAGISSLPVDPLSTFLDQPGEIRVVSQTALPDGDRSSIKQTEWTYALMIHFSKSLGVNCTYCHNSRSFTDWDQSTPQRATAWYGIRMVRDLNMHYLDPLAMTLPPNRHGPEGDGPKVDCATCHQGAYKPLFGASMLKDFPALAKPTTDGAPIVAGAAAPAPAVASSPVTPSTTIAQGTANVTAH